MTDPTNDAVPPAYTPQPGSSQPAAYSGSGAPAKKTLSITSMILGIVGVLAIITTWPAILLGLAAVITGHLAQRREKVAGRGFWLTGLITGYVAIAGGLLLLILVFVAAAVLSNDPRYSN